MMTIDQQKQLYDSLVLAVKKASQETPDAELAEFTAIMFAVVNACYESVFGSEAGPRYLSALAIQMATHAETEDHAHATLRAAMVVAGRQEVQEALKRQSSKPPQEGN